MHEPKKSPPHVLWKLFFSTLYISAFTFGGGFVIITFMKRKFVEELHWLDEEEMLDMAALAQSAPGAIAVNAAILVGWRVAGFPGMLVATLGTVLPPMAVLSVVSLFYAAFAQNVYVAAVLKGMQAGVAAVILDVVCQLGAGVAKERSAVHLALLAAAFAATFFFRVNVIFVILAGVFCVPASRRAACCLLRIAYCVLLEYPNCLFLSVTVSHCAKLFSGAARGRAKRRAARRFLQNPQKGNEKGDAKGTAAA